MSIATGKITCFHMFVGMVVLNDEYMKNLFNKNYRKKVKSRLLVSDKRISEMESLEEFKEFKVIDLRNNCIKEIENVSNQSNLTHLYLQYNEIECLKGFNFLTSLEVLYLDFNKIEIIENLDFCPLKKLSARGQKLSEAQMFAFDPLCMERLKEHLEEMDISLNNLCTIQALRCCKTLKKLDLSSNKLSNLDKLSQDLSRMENLREIDIQDNPVVTNPDFIVQIVSKCKHIDRLNRYYITNETRDCCENISRKKTSFYPQPSESLKYIYAAMRSSSDIPSPLKPKMTAELIQEMKRKKEAIKKIF